MKNEIELLGLEFDTKFYNRCEQFVELLQKWGKVHSFTTQLSTKEIEENIIDSIYPLKFIEDFNSFADIGTGAGYPGLLLAIARPDVKCYLIEPRIKRVAFLNFVKSALGLENVTVIGSRVEECEGVSVELVTSRAVTDTKLLMDLTQNISTSSTKYLFYKGSLCKEEIKEFDDLNSFQILPVGEHRNYLYIKGDIDDN